MLYEFARTYPQRMMTRFVSCRGPNQAHHFKSFLRSPEDIVTILVLSYASKLLYYR